jgi:sulfide:quinone oxidoreductase
VLIAGGGIAGVEALLALRSVAGQGPSIELLSPDPDLAYRPLRVVEPFELGGVRRFPLRGIAGDQGATFRAGALTSVDPEGRRARQRSGEWLGYDALLVATGASAQNAVPGALLFHGRGGTNDLTAALDAARDGRIGSLAFAVPSGVSWPLPLYELALLTAWRLQKDGVKGVTLAFVTPENEPLEVFGAEAAAQVRRLLDQRGIELRTGARPVEARGGQLALAGGSSLPADAAITVPCLEGRRTFGLPADREGFIPVDEHGRVEGLEDVFVAGDEANFPVKQGGLATQQADAAAEAIAAQLGSPLPPQPFRPVLRAVLFTGSAPLYLRTDLHADPSPAEASGRPLWSPPGKIAGRYLSPYLAQLERPTADPPVFEDRQP